MGETCGGGGVVGVVMMWMLEDCCSSGVVGMFSTRVLERER